MRKRILGRIKYHVTFPTGEGDLTRNTSRWGPVQAYIYRLTGKDPESKQGRKESRLIGIDDIDMETITDTQLLELYETVVRRFYICM